MVNHLVNHLVKCVQRALSQRRKLENVGAETMSSGRPFQIRGPETSKVRLPTVDSRNIGISVFRSLLMYSLAAIFLRGHAVSTAVLV